MKLSIFIPSRERVQLLDKCLESIYTKCSNQHDIETIVAIDDDDISNHAYLEECPYPTKYFSQPRSDELTNAYINKSVSQLDGDIIWGLGNDCEIIEQDYDLIFFDNYPKWPDRLGYFYMDDGIPPDHFQYGKSCCFPAMTKRTVELLGCFIPREIVAWGGDIALFEIIKLLPENRVINLRDKLHVIHKAQHTKSGEQDSVNHRIASISLRCDRLSGQQINQYALPLIEEINKCRN